MSRCALCPGAHKCIEPDGPIDADYLFIGEAPGATEEKVNRPFVGKTGEEVNAHFLPLAGLRREDVLFDNSISCYPISTGGKLDPKRAKDQELLRTCAEHHLYSLIERVRPRVIITLGAFAAMALGIENTLDLQHGIPVQTAWGPVFPMFHPAQGLHEPKKLLHIRTDWMRLKQYLRGKLVMPRDEYPNPDYAEVTDVRDILSIPPCDPIGMDTETTRGGDPFCLTYSHEQGTGRLIRASRHDLLRAFQAHLRRRQGPVLFHNWMFDRPITQAMGLSITDRMVIDTMVQVFHLGNLPQGLKALAFRELGMLMQDFDDLVTPYSSQLVTNYYLDAYTQEHPWTKPEEQIVRQPDGRWKLYKPQGLQTKLKRLMTELRKHADKDVFGVWDNWEDHQPELEEICGPYPGKCVSHAPFDEVLHYACRDSDATLRLFYLLERMRRQVRRRPQELWRVA